VLALAPENITVHTLSLKKGSRITLEGKALPSAQDVGRMLDLAGTRLRETGYAPYYLYRQKFISGGFENVGWAKPGYECLYNVMIMDEAAPVIGAGAGATSKFTNRATGAIERVTNKKDPQEYIAAIDEICDKKRSSAPLLLP
jgi:oxygen-independent coproporphyrinogen-3 oxidase